MPSEFAKRWSESSVCLAFSHVSRPREGGDLCSPRAGLIEKQNILVHRGPARLKTAGCSGLLVLGFSSAKLPGCLPASHIYEGREGTGARLRLHRAAHSHRGVCVLK